MLDLAEQYPTETSQSVVDSPRLPSQGFLVLGGCMPKRRPLLIYIKVSARSGVI